MTSRKRWKFFWFLYWSTSNKCQ